MRDPLFLIGVPEVQARAPNVSPEPSWRSRRPSRSSCGKMNLQRLVITILILLLLVRRLRRTRNDTASDPNIFDRSISSLNPKAVVLVLKRREREPRFKPKKTRGQRRHAKKMNEGSKGRRSQETIKVYSQNIHGLFESAKNENGKAINGGRGCQMRGIIFLPRGTVGGTANKPQTTDQKSSALVS